MIELRNVSKTYKSKKGVSTKALDDVSIKLPDTGLIFIVGKSGSGKSTLLNLISGLDKEDSGEIIVDGKSLKKFKSKDYDYYRNRYIGFVFQEFNLISEYNVYDNILLSLKLQKIKCSKNDCDLLLDKLGLNGLGNRKVYELSGGQKQRVSIGRALIKNPKVLIADEPTGSLDEVSGKGIFEILKAVSKDRLVIVVSHDIESAKTYADNIIEISDGKVIYNTLNIEIVSTQSFTSIKSKLPFKDKLKFALLNLGRHKIRLIFTILLICASLTFFQISKNMGNIDIIYTHREALNNLNSNYIDIKKYEVIGNSLGPFERYFNNEDRENIIDKIGSNYLLKYRIQENGEYLTLDYNEENMLAKNGFSRDAYYFHDRTKDRFVISSNTYLEGKEILGRMPEDNDEIMIHSHLADIFMKVGIGEYIEIDETTIVKKSYYYPKSYEELLNTSKYIKLGSDYKLKVVGIIMDDVDEYEYIKNVESLESMYSYVDGIEKIKDKKFMQFLIDVVEPSYEIYVREEFINEENYKRNTRMTDTILVTEGEKSSNSRSGYLNGKLEYYDGNKFKEIDSLNSNEIILGTNYLNSISDGEYNKNLEKFISDYEKENKPKQEEKLEIQKRNEEKLNKYQKEVDKLLKDQENGLRLDEVIEFPQFEKVPDFEYKDEYTLKEDFFLDYMKDKDLVGKTISIKFIMQDSYSAVSEYKDVLIRGFSVTTDMSFVSDDIGNEAITDNVLNTEIKVYEPDKDKMYKLLKTYPIPLYQYTNLDVKLPPFQSRSFISNDIISVGQSAFAYSKITLYISIVFAVFAFILITNFIAISITGNKKTIGILRALGTKRIDIFKIFLNQSLIMCGISFILSIVITFILKEIGNGFISNYYSYKIELFLYSGQNIWLTLGVLIITIILSNLFIINKIASMKPVDAINEK